VDRGGGAWEKGWGRLSIRLEGGGGKGKKGIAQSTSFSGGGNQISLRGGRKGGGFGYRIPKKIIGDQRGGGGLF